MRRLFIDFLGFTLLIGLGYVVDLAAINNILVGFTVPVAVSFGRGFAERRFLANVPYWLGGIEWLVIVFIEYTISCYLGVLLRPYDNFETVFGFGLLIILAPTELLSVISYWFGILVVARANRKPT